MSTYIKETHLKNVQSIVVLCGLECEKLSKEAKLVKEVSNQRNRHHLKKEKKRGETYGRGDLLGSTRCGSMKLEIWNRPCMWGVRFQSGVF